MYWRGILVPPCDRNWNWNWNWRSGIGIGIVSSGIGIGIGIVKSENAGIGIGIAKSELTPALVGSQVVPQSSSSKYVKGDTAMWYCIGKLSPHKSIMLTLNLVNDDVITWRYFQRYWPFVRGIHRSSVNSPHKGQWRGALIFSLICAWINGWVNNRQANDWRCHHAHCGVIVMDLFTYMYRIPNINRIILFHVQWTVKLINNHIVRYEL